MQFVYNTAVHLHSVWLLALASQTASFERHSWQPTAKHQLLSVLGLSGASLLVSLYSLWPLFDLPLRSLWVLFGSLGRLWVHFGFSLGSFCTTVYTCGCPRSPQR